MSIIIVNKIAIGKNLDFAHLGNQLGAKGQRLGRSRQGGGKFDG